MIAASNMTSQNSNRRIAIGLGTLVLVMVGLSYASVPLYDLFCRVTGYGGTTQVANAKSNQIIKGHPVAVRFDANVNPALNWKFVPLESKVTVIQVRKLSSIIAQLTRAHCQAQVRQHSM